MCVCALVWDNERYQKKSLSIGHQKEHIGVDLNY